MITRFHTPKIGSRQPINSLFQLPHTIEFGITKKKEEGKVENGAKWLSQKGKRTEISHLRPHKEKNSVKQIVRDKGSLI